MQTTAHLLMIRPVQFGFNAQTAVNNAFQTADGDPDAAEKAAKEFEGLAGLLRRNGVDLLVVPDTPEPHTPDSIFPNNWVSFHENGTLCLYPMFAANRRPERNPAVLDLVAERFCISHTIDLSGYEAENRFLEGTGSMVLDREHKIAYACLSARTHPAVLNDFCARMGYRPVVFTAVDANGLPIYHSNVILCVADRYVVACLECIPDTGERRTVLQAIRDSGKALFEITLNQVNHFAGNMLQVQNDRGEKLVVLSEQAYRSLSEEQVARLASWNRILYAPLTTIETLGGGSARCMLAEIFLPEKA